MKYHHQSWSRCPSCKKDGLEFVYQKDGFEKVYQLIPLPCKYCGQAFLLSVIKKWWWVSLLVVIVFCIWDFTGTTKHAAEPAWPSGKPKAATEAEIAVKARAFADFKAPAEAKEQSAIVEKAIRKQIRKPTGKLTKADLEKVTRLYLGNTKITDAGLMEVAKLKQLSVLNLGGTHATNTGLKELGKLQQLTELYLYETKITDEGLKELAKLQQLKTLSLKDTKVTKAGVAELQKALPKCDVRSNPTK